MFCGPHTTHRSEVTGGLRILSLLLTAAVLWLGDAVSAHAKCVPLAIEVKARIPLPVPEGVDIAVYSHPEGQGKAPILNSETGDVSVTLWFDSYSGSSFWRGDKCSRQPKEVGVRLLVGKAERAKVVLLFPEHFERRGPGHWVSKRIVSLELGANTKATDSHGPQNKAFKLTSSRKAWRHFVPPRLGRTSQLNAMFSGRFRRAPRSK